MYERIAKYKDSERFRYLCNRIARPALKISEGGSDF